MSTNNNNETGAPADAAGATSNANNNRNDEGGDDVANNHNDEGGDGEANNHNNLGSHDEANNRNDQGGDNEVDNGNNQGGDDEANNRNDAFEMEAIHEWVANLFPRRPASPPRPWVPEQINNTEGERAMFAEAVRINNVPDPSNPENGRRDMMVCVAIMPGGTEIDLNTGFDPMTLNQEDMMSVEVTSQLGFDYIDPDTWFPDKMKNSALYPYIRRAFQQRLNQRSEVREHLPRCIPSRATIQLPARAHQDGWVDPTDLDFTELHDGSFLVNFGPRNLIGRKLVFEGFIVIGFLWVA